jgi:hypothetical protein
MPGFMNQQQILGDLFTEPGPGAAAGTPGLGLNVLRYNLGASLSPTQESPSCQGSKLPGRTVPSLEPWSGKVHADNDPDQERVLEQATALIKDTGASPITEAFANSPPWWLLHSAGQCTSGGTGGIPDLPWGNDYAYAHYLYKVVTALEKRTRADVNTVEPVRVTLSGGAAVSGLPGQAYTTMTLSYPGSRPPQYDASGSAEPGPPTATIHLWKPPAG